MFERLNIEWNLIVGYKAIDCPKQNNQPRGKGVITREVVEGSTKQTLPSGRKAKNRSSQRKTSLGEPRGNCKTRGKNPAQRGTGIPSIPLESKKGTITYFHKAKGEYENRKLLR